jgi:hypothetical protein
MRAAVRDRSILDLEMNQLTYINLTYILNSSLKLEISPKLYSMVRGLSDSLYIVQLKEIKFLSGAG